MSLFQKTVSALVATILENRFGVLPQQKPELCGRVVGFVVAQCGRMPDYLRFPFVVLTCYFGLISIVLTGKPFHGGSLVQRSKQVLRWKTAALGPHKNLIKFYESFAIFKYYDLLESGNERECHK